MIVGRGLIGGGLKIIDAENVLFYANGISNSVLNEIPHDNFEIKELEAIAGNHPEKLFVYFSTSQVNSEKNHSRPYVKHKLSIEEFISRNFSRYLIVRTSNLVGFNPWNSHTLFNYLHHALAVNERICVNPALIRNFLDVDHFVSLLQEYISNYPLNKTVEIVNPESYSMGEIINEFEKFFSKKFTVQFSTVTDFAVFELNPQLSLRLMEKSGVCFRDPIAALLKKYYSPEPLKKRVSVAKE